MYSEGDRNMVRVHVICEGQTEEAFVKNLLVEPLARRGIYLSPSLIGTVGHKGGNVNFERLLTDTKKRLTDDKSCYCTTFLDFYALPTDFPGQQTASKQAHIADKAQAVYGELVEKLAVRMGDAPLRRFIPYVQMYEFEALLFSDPSGFAKGINEPLVAPKLQAIRQAFPTPEEINASPQTAPSKRVMQLVPKYVKPLYGALAALEIGLDKMRAECALFHAWLTQLENLTP